MLNLVFNSCCFSKIWFTLVSSVNYSLLMTLKNILRLHLEIFSPYSHCSTHIISFRVPEICQVASYLSGPLNLMFLCLKVPFPGLYGSVIIPPLQFSLCYLVIAGTSPFIMLVICLHMT